MSKKRIFRPFGGKLGQFAFEWEREGVALHAESMYMSNLTIDVFHNGKWQGNKDLGSGLVTNAGVLALANDGFIAGVSAAPINLFALSKFHSSGTGVTGAATTDIKLGTPITTIATPVVTGTNTLVSAANLQKLQSVATIVYDASGPYAVTEWGLFAGATLSSATASPFTAGSATTGTLTGAVTASSTTVQGLQQNIIENTGNATPHWGLNTSNTTTVVTVPAWYKVSDGTAAGTFPANTNTMVTRPVMWDRKQFTAVNVANGDSIQFTYTLTMTSGG